MKLLPKDAGLFPGEDFLEKLNAGHELIERRVGRLAREIGETFAMQAAMGRVLLDLCEQHGSFDKWRKEDPRPLKFSRSTAHNYMRIALRPPEELASASGYRMLGLLPPGEGSGTSEGNGPQMTPVAKAITWLGKVRAAFRDCGERAFESPEEAQAFLDETEELVTLREQAAAITAA